MWMEFQRERENYVVSVAATQIKQKQKYCRKVNKKKHKNS